MAYSAVGGSRPFAIGRVPVAGDAIAHVQDTHLPDPLHTSHVAVAFLTDTLHAPKVSLKSSDMGLVNKLDMVRKPVYPNPVNNLLAFPGSPQLQYLRVLCAVCGAFYHLVASHALLNGGNSGGGPLSHVAMAELTLNLGVLDVGNVAKGYGLYWPFGDRYVDTDY
ncbi:MAG: hypothetical protein HW403_20 [Dehalococcoidia bacterium]|nr:hypothetical protein [Dehalococcoidia bacterium]